MTAVIQNFVFPGAWVAHALWAVAHMVVITQGPGRLSLDNALGLDRGARPASRAAFVECPAPRVGRLGVVTSAAPLHAETPAPVCSL